MEMVSDGIIDITWVRTFDVKEPNELPTGIAAQFSEDTACRFYRIVESVKQHVAFVVVPRGCGRHDIERRLDDAEAGPVDIYPFRDKVSILARGRGSKLFCGRLRIYVNKEIRIRIQRGNESTKLLWICMTED
jgi:hypothetical protein